MNLRIEYQSNISETEKSICEKYWSLKDRKKRNFVYSCKQIENEFGIKYHEINKIVKNKSEAVVLDCECIDCGVHKICKTRSELKRVKISTTNWRCSKCRNIIEEQRYQTWIEERNKQKKLEEQCRQAKIERLDEYRNSHQINIPSIDGLELVDRLLLVTIIESLGSESLKSTISLRNNLILPLTPTRTLDIQILDLLYKKNILLLNSKSSLDYAEFDEHGNLIINFYNATFDFAYDLNNLAEISIDVKAKHNIHHLIKNERFKQLCQDIQLAECLSFLNYTAKKFGLAPSTGAKMITLIRTALVEYSVAEISRLIWMAVRDSASYAQMPNITLKRASNSIYGNIQNNIEKVSNRVWKRKQFNRDTNLKQSAIAKIFFDNTFKIDDCGFRYTLDALLDRFKNPELPIESRYTVLGHKYSFSQTINFLN